VGESVVGMEYLLPWDTCEEESAYFPKLAINCVNVGNIVQRGKIVPLEFFFLKILQFCSRYENILVYSVMYRYILS
jgi:hypothetical protein